MNNVWLVFRRDVANLFRNVMSVIIAVGLVVLPSVVAWYNILACWDVFSNTGNLTVAVANQDEGYTSDLLPIGVNVGEKVVSGLRANDQINWVFTDGDDAIEGTKAGTYYAALVIPADFSRQMLTFYEGDSHSANIDYYVNEKINAIAPNITGTGADKVSYEINEAFAQTVSEIAIGLAESLSQRAQDHDVDGRIALLADHLRGVASRIDQTADVLGLYSLLARDSQSLVGSSAELIESARTQANGVASSMGGSEQTLRDLAAVLSASVDELASSLEKSKGMLDGIAPDVDALVGGASSDVSAVAAGLRQEASFIDSDAEKCSSLIERLEKLRDDLKQGVSHEIDASVTGDAAEIELSRETTVVVEDTLILDKDIALLSKALEMLQDASTTCTDAADRLDAANAESQGKVESLRELAAQVRSDIDVVKSAFDVDLMPDANALKADVEVLVSDLDQAADKLGALSPELSGLVDAAGALVGDAGVKVDEATAKLRTAAQGLRGLGDAMDAALASGDLEVLRSLLQGNVDELAAALAAPVQVERTAVFPVDSFGSAMSPLYSTLALFIGSLLIMVAMKPEVSQKGREGLRDPKPRQLYFGRFGVVALISLAQSTLMALGNMLFLKVQVDSPLLFMLCFWFSGLVFAFIVYTLVVAFGNLGKGIAVLLLIIQVTACGGSYPLQILPDFVQKISPFLPATHVVNAMRAAMMGVYQNDFWISLGCLALFLVPFLLLGLVLRKPLERFMRFYVSKVEASKLME